MFSINNILKATGGRLLSGGKKRRVSGVSIDSRTIKKNELFIAIKGERFDGHDFISAAVKKGACGIIIARDTERVKKDTPVIKVKDTLKALGDIAAFHRKRFDIPVVGITGSNGKTTVKEMVWHILSKRYDVLKNTGTKNNLIGLPLTLLGLNKNHSIAVLEMGANHLGEIKRLTEILKPAIGLITNIGPSHLEFLKDKKGVLEAKSELAYKLRRGDLLVLNGDDALLSRIRVKCRKIRFGLGKKNDFRATDIKSNGRISFNLNNLYPLRINLLGKHNLYNALAAIAVTYHFGVDMFTIREALLDFKFSHMRMELKNVRGIKIINDSYNSNPLSLKWAISTLSGFKTDGKKILVSGDMLELGKKSRFFHSQAGSLIAASSIDALICVGKFSRYTASAATQAGMKKYRLYPCEDSKEAAGILKRIVKPGDAVLVKGSRGMAMERVIDSL